MIRRLETLPLAFGIQETIRPRQLIGALSDFPDTFSRDPEN